MWDIFIVLLYFFVALLEFSSGWVAELKPKWLYVLIL